MSEELAVQEVACDSRLRESAADRAPREPRLPGGAAALRPAIHSGQGEGGGWRLVLRGGREGAVHLENAARALQRILTRRDPEHTYVVSVRPWDRDDAGRAASTPAGKPNGSTPAQHPGPVGHWNLAAPSDGANDYRGQETA